MNVAGQGRLYFRIWLLVGLLQQNSGQCWPHCLGAMFGFWCIRKQLFPDCINRLAFSRWDSWLGKADLDHASDLTTHPLTVFSTVCVGWRPTFYLSLLFVVVLSVGQLTASAGRRATRKTVAKAATPPRRLCLGCEHGLHCCVSAKRPVANAFQKWRKKSVYKTTIIYKMVSLSKDSLLHTWMFQTSSVKTPIRR